MKKALYWIAWQEDGGGQRFYPMRLQVKRETLMLHIGLWEAGRRISEANLAAAEASGLESDLADCRYGLAGFLSRFGKRERALELYHQAIAVFLSMGESLKVALAERNIGNIQKLLGRPEEALASYQKAIKYFRDNGRHLELSETLSNLANIHADRREYRRAWALYQEAIALAREHGHLSSLGNALYNAASVMMEQNDPMTALSLYQQALQIHQRIGDRSSIAYDIGSIGEVYLQTGKQRQAMEHFEEVERISREIGDRYSVAYAHEYIGRALLGLGRAEEALARLRQGCELAAALKDGESEARARGWLGVACADLGRMPEAEVHLATAIAESEQRGLDYQLCDWHYHLAEVLLASGRDGIGHNRQAEDTAVKIGRSDMVFLCRVQRAEIDFVKAEDDKGKARAVETLKSMMEEGHDKGRKARLYFECWRMLAAMGNHGEAGIMGTKSATLYRELAGETEGAECRARLGKLAEAGIETEKE